MALRTFAWFYGQDYQLVNIHNARNPTHPYYGHPQLYGAVDAIYFSAQHYVHTVRRRICMSIASETLGDMRFYEEGTQAWYEKFERPRGLFESYTPFPGLDNETMAEDEVERIHSWFELEIPISFVSTILFEYLTTLETLAEVSVVTFRIDDVGKLTPHFQSIFQPVQVQSVQTIVTRDDAPYQRVRCRLYYAQHRFEFFDNKKSTPLSHHYCRINVPFDFEALARAKSRVEMASNTAQWLIKEGKTTAGKAAQALLIKAAPKNIKKYKLMLHQISTSSTTSFYGKPVAPGELDDFLFCIAPKKYELFDFVKAVYVNATEAHFQHFKSINSHLGDKIEPGQIAYIFPKENELFRKFKYDLHNSAKKINALRLNQSDEESAFLAQHFAVMGSFAPSVGKTKNYYALDNEMPVFPQTPAEIAGMIPQAAQAGIEIYQDKIKNILDNYNFEHNTAFKAARTDALKAMDKSAINMLDTLMEGEHVTRNGFLKAVNEAFVGIQRWVPTASRLVPLDDLYAAVQKVNLGLKGVGYLGIGFDGWKTHQYIQEACTVAREDECRKITYKEWGGFSGRFGGGALLAAGLAAVAAPMTMGWSIVFVVGGTAVLSQPAAYAGDFIGEMGGTIFYRLNYSRDEDGNNIIDF